MLNYKRAMCACLSLLGTALPVQAELRHLNPGDPLPALTLSDDQGQIVKLSARPGQIQVICYLPGRAETARAILNEIQPLNRQWLNHDPPVRWVGILSSAAAQNEMTRLAAEEKVDITILADPNYAAWGQLGIIATPTTLIVDSAGRIAHVLSGHGYNFAPELQSHLQQLIEGVSTDTSKDVEFLHNDTPLARMRRHIQMAKILEQKGRIKEAIAEIEKARQLQPANNEVQVELGQLLCKAGKSQEALDAIKEIQPAGRIEESVVAFVTGWAYRQMGDLEKARTLLEKAVELNPNSARVLYELGKTYQAANESEKALQTYRKALDLVFLETQPATP